MTAAETGPGTCYLGVDVGSVTTKAVLLAEGAGEGRPGEDQSPGSGLASGWELRARTVLATAGRPLRTLQQALGQLAEGAGGPGAVSVLGVATTGSGRSLAGTVIGADLVKNEITAHAVAALNHNPDVRTVLEIGGQDSKLIILRDGVVVDFAMNTVCAAGTGSFLDRQAARLGIPIEEFGRLAAEGRNPVRIAGRCAVFAETDMIHKQQIGHSIPDIVQGLCQALVRNYVNNLGKGKEILPPVMFQGGVAANSGMVSAFEAALGTPVGVPPDHELMGAIGAAMLAREAREAGRIRATRFRGFEIAHRKLEARGFDCDKCPNQCEIVELYQDGVLVARWGGKCGRWELAAS